MNLFRFITRRMRHGVIVLVIGLGACGQLPTAIEAPLAAAPQTSLQQAGRAFTVLATAIPTVTPTIAPTATPTPTVVPQITGYAAYRVREGDTIAAISERGGSDAELLMRYNRLTEAPQPGRELLVPQILGETSQITKTQMMVVRGNTQQRWVALTFDCGGVNPNTEHLLDILRDAKLHVTFFLLGDSVIQNPPLLRRMVREGHEIANHSYSHADFTTLTPAQMREELDKTEAVIQDILGDSYTTRPYVRLPYGAYNDTVIQTVVQHGYLPIHWSVDSFDSHGKPKTPDEIAALVIKQLTDEQVSGAIVLMHCMNKSIAAVPQILDNLRQRNIEVRTVTEVLGR